VSRYVSQDTLLRSPACQSGRRVRPPQRCTSGDTANSRKEHDDGASRQHALSHHPGVLKMEQARAYAERDGIPWPVAVDDVDGTLHRMLDPKPDAAYLVGTDGTVLFRSLWANHPGPLQQALSAVASGPEAPLGQNEAKAEALLRGTGKMWETLSAAGPVALRDVAKQAPPMWLSARLAHLFQPLPLLARGAVGVMLPPAVALGAAWACGVGTGDSAGRLLVSERLPERSWLVSRPGGRLLAGLVSFYFEKLDTWLVEDDEQIGHPRDPFHRVDARRSSRQVTVQIDGQVVAETRAPVAVAETGMPVRWYVPEADVRDGVLVPSETTSVCTYKGVAGYEHAVVGGRRYEDVAWHYPEPLLERCPPPATGPSTATRWRSRPPPEPPSGHLRGEVGQVAGTQRRRGEARRVRREPLRSIHAVVRPARAAPSVSHGCTATSNMSAGSVPQVRAATRRPPGPASRSRRPPPTAAPRTRRGCRRR
jgi:uncharacterized protein (DUF427 family)